MVAVTPDPNALHKLISTAAATFITTYYPALASKPSTIANFYSPNATILFNGNQIASPQAFAIMYTTMPKAKFDVESYDAQSVLVNGKGSASFVLLVSGRVTLGSGSSEKQRAFSETFVLRPDKDDSTRFLVGSQGFRFVI